MLQTTPPELASTAAADGPRPVPCGPDCTCHKGPEVLQMTRSQGVPRARMRCRTCGRTWIRIAIPDDSDGE